MIIFKKSLQILSIILFLLAGQLQANPVSSCSMTMDRSDSEFSQPDHDPCPNRDHDDSAPLNAPVSDLVLELDIDPYEEKLTTYNPVFQSQATVLISIFSRTNPYQDGSKIHLITQRLRI